MDRRPHIPISSLTDKREWDEFANTLSGRDLDEDIEANIGLILQRLQDLNWPGSSEIAQYLLRLPFQLLLPHLLDILDTDEADFVIFELLILQRLLCVREAEEMMMQLEERYHGSDLTRDILRLKPYLPLLSIDDSIWNEE
ncbi:hypothetical protein PROFUN_03750 [Planoprotostelium fungivorum]|uniref:DUF5071 domain-containing protein n=1 Tax=Planoprotostelium fungivorum TaxID=1890364 RepID=A0A2P6NDN8_9EUKA|nr:hypothetical protein PROFUN_03750 [Planoprotostelium fungivorum]